MIMLQFQTSEAVNLYVLLFNDNQKEETLSTISFSLSLYSWRKNGLLLICGI